MKNRKVILKKFKKAMALVLAGVISFGNIVPAYAATTPKRLDVRMTGVMYSYDSAGKPAGLNKMGIFKSGNSEFKAVYCGEHSIQPPMNEGETKSLSIEKYNSYNDIRKILYYGYDGPEQWSGFSNSSYNKVYQLFSGNAAKTKTEACGRAVTATALTKAYRNHGGKGYVYDVSGLSAFESYIASGPMSRKSTN